MGSLRPARGAARPTLAAIALAVVAALPPRRRDVIVVCALAAAVLIAVQLALGHWFYIYAVWFLPPLWLALLAQYEEPAAAGRAPRRATAG